MAGWLSSPLHLHSSRAFHCDDFTPEQCEYYQEKWHFWYQADHVFALPTVAFFMCGIGLFIIGHFITRLSVLGKKQETSLLWRKSLAATRYLAYRGFHIERLRWSSAPVGILLLGAIGATYFFCMDLIPQPYYWPALLYGHSPPLATRSGWLALACMPFVFATSSKTNWITLLTGVSHEKLQVFHRWISYAFFILSLMHTFPFIVYSIDYHIMVEQFTKGALVFYWTGIVAIICQAWLTFASHSSIRKFLGYEFFKAAHFTAVVVFVLLLFWHCNAMLSSWDYFIATAAIYVPCFIFAWVRTIFEHGTSQKARLYVEDNGFTRIEIPAQFNWALGQHCFLRFTSFGIHAFSSHPFTICSLPEFDGQSTATFYIRHQGGFTARLYNYALSRPGVLVPVLVDGPYGGLDMNKFDGSDRLVVIAGGSGAGWSLSFIEEFARRSLPWMKHNAPLETSSSEESKPALEKGNNGSGLTRSQSMRVVLSTRDTATRVWYHNAINELLRKYSLDASAIEIDVQVYLTGEAEKHTHIPNTSTDPEESNSSSSLEELNITLKDKDEKEGSTPDKAAGEELCGRPDLPSIIQEETGKSCENGDSIGVFVCGPSTMQNDVRNAVASANLGILKGSRSGEVYLHTESFSWA